MKREQIYVVAIVVLLVGVLTGYVLTTPIDEPLDEDTTYEYRVLIYDYRRGGTLLGSIEDNIESGYVNVWADSEHTSQGFVENFDLKEYEYNSRIVLMGEGIVQILKSRMKHWLVQVTLNTTTNMTLSYNIYLSQYQNGSLWQHLSGNIWQYGFTYHHAFSPYVVEIQLVEVE